VPYPQWAAEDITAQVQTQAKTISDDLRTSQAYVAPDREIVALIAYLQKLGKFEKVAPAQAAFNTKP
jgi:cytochrome c oxidase cbb3-type subunit I/II